MRDSAARHALLQQDMMSAICYVIIIQSSNQGRDALRRRVNKMPDY